MKQVSIITSTTGRPELRRAIESVRHQSYPHIQHFIAVDGPAHHEKARIIVKDHPGVDVLYLPYPTKQWGTRIHAALPHLSKGDYIEFLDDDNHIEPNHVENMIRTIEDRPWAYSLRNLSLDGMFVAQDHCESLGYLHPAWNTINTGQPQHHIDTGCFFLRRDVALELCCHWSPVEFDHPGYYINDRIFFAALHARYPGAPGSPTIPVSLEHTFNYEIDRDVFNYFREGNRVMAARYNGRIPWLSASPARGLS
ncbi:MAG TPA: glycosyltransferase family 2 protein [Candidatus Kapabacteria bacterium]|nr:glycosyltransferase family 2 protein [Candidatus Kapabacteria bacterium]